MVGRKMGTRQKAYFENEKRTNIIFNNKNGTILSSCKQKEMTRMIANESAHKEATKLILNLLSLPKPNNCKSVSFYLLSFGFEYFSSVLLKY